MNKHQELTRSACERSEQMQLVLNNLTAQLDNVGSQELGKFLGQLREFIKEQTTTIKILADALDLADQNYQRLSAELQVAIQNQKEVLAKVTQICNSL